MSEFEVAVSAVRVGANNKAANAYPSAVGGSNGGFPAGPTEDYSASSEFGQAVTNTRMQANVSPSGLAPGGMAGFVRGDISTHEYTPSSEFNSAASNTCGGDAQRAKSWPDAQGGWLGSTTDGYKD